MIRQRTLKTAIQATGVGVHTGEKIFITLRPAPENTGIVFCRTDLDPVISIPARVEYVCDTQLCTTLANEGVRIATVEHLLSACYGLGIDNLYVDISAPELPIMDGSAIPFVFLMQSAGLQDQNAFKRFLRIKKTVRVKQGDKWAQLRPYSGFKVEFGIQFDHPAFDSKNQNNVFEFSPMTYIKQVARARTFGFLREYEAIRRHNLALGASMDNAIVLDEFKVLNQDGLRYQDECVRHKILDVIGDLYLLGYSLIGSFQGYKSGHALNNCLLKKLLATRDAWEIITEPDTTERGISFLSPILTDLEVA